MLRLKLNHVSKRGHRNQSYYDKMQSLNGITYDFNISCEVILIQMQEDLIG